MKMYQVPELEVVLLANEDIVTLSVVGEGGDPLELEF